MSSKVVRDAVDTLIPAQVGVMVEGACETVPMALQRLVEDRVGDSDWAVLRVEFGQRLQYNGPRGNFEICLN